MKRRVKSKMHIVYLRRARARTVCTTFDRKYVLKKRKIAYYVSYCFALGDPSTTATLSPAQDDVLSNLVHSGVLSNLVHSGVLSNFILSSY